MGFDESLLLNLVILLTAALVAGYVYLKWKYQYWDRMGVPNLAPRTVLGNIKNPFKERVDILSIFIPVYTLAKIKGWKHVGIYGLASPSYIAMDLELIKHILTKDFGHFVDRGLYVNEKDDPLTAHLFNLGGKKWRDLRVKLTPTFTSGKLRQMFQTLVDCGLVMEKYIIENISSTDPVDIKKILGNFSTDIIGSCAFGLECNSFKEPNSPFRVYMHRFFTRTRLHEFKSSITSRFPNLGRALGIREIDRELSDFYRNVVDDTVEYRLKNNYRRKDLLQLLIDMRNQRDEKDDGYQKDGGALTRNEIAAQCFLFFVAGFETSSTTMTFALFELAKRQDLQEKVREELIRVLKKYDNQITYDSLSELKYLKQVIDETLRIYPAVPVLVRECVKDFKVPGEDAVIEKGIRVLIPVADIHRDDRYYEKPKVFDPDRFSDENRLNIPQYAHIPFGEGPRNCIGERFGLMQSKVGLACILRNFKVTLNEKTKLPIKMEPSKVVPEVKGGLWLNLEKLD